MEMNAANFARHKLFREEPSFVDKNMDEKKADSVSYLQKKYRKSWTMLSQ